MTNQRPWNERWIEERPLGGGGQGDTILVVDKACQHSPHAVLKLLKAGKANDQKARRRMAQEVTNLKVLHSAGGKVPRILDSNTESFENPDIPLYFVMECISGQTLASAIETGSGVSLEKAIGITLDLCYTVRIASKEGIVHRDIKPENIIVGGMEPPNVFMVDFGLSFNEDDTSTFTSENEALDNKFISLPERRGPGEDKRDFRSDLTGLCAILFYCLTTCAPRNLRDSKGRPPHRWPDFYLSGKVQNPVQLSFLNALLDVGLSYELDQRFQSVDQMENRLKEVLNPPAELPVDDIETVAAREASALRKNDRKTQLAEFLANLLTLRTKLGTHTQSIQQKLSPFKQFTFLNNELVHPTQVKRTEGDCLTQGKLTVAIKNHAIRHEILYTVIAQGMECVLYRETNEIISQSPFTPGVPTSNLSHKPVEPSVVVFRYHGDTVPDESIWCTDIEHSVARSIAALSKKVQTGYTTV